MQVNAELFPLQVGHLKANPFKGRILNNGADWQIVDSKGLAIIDTRYLLETDDGALIYLQTKGYRHGSAETLKQLAQGKDVDPKITISKLPCSLKPAHQNIHGSIRPLR